MDIRSLRTFLLAAKHENYREVAEKLYLTQPAISFQIKQLEKELGGNLFIKEGRNIVLTEFGRVFSKEAELLISQYEDSIHRIKQYKQGFYKLVRIAISPLFADTILPTILQKYMDAHPHVELTIHVMESSEISKHIENGDVDLGLSCLPGSSLIKSIQFHEEDVILVTRHDGYDAESGPVLDGMDILEQNIVFTDNHPGYWGALRDELMIHHPSLRTMRVNQSYITKRFVLEGIGVSFLPKSIINREILEGRLLEVPIDFMELPKASMHLVYRNDKEFNPELALSLIHI